MRVVFADHVTDDAGRLHMARAFVEAHPVHGVENAALYRLLAVGGGGQGAACDDAHRVFEIAAGGVIGRRRNVRGRRRYRRWQLWRLAG